MKASDLAASKGMHLPLLNLLHEFQSGKLQTAEDALHWARRYPKALKMARQAAGVRPVPMGGSRTWGLSEGYFQTGLRDGTVGYFQRDVDDCARAGVATLLGMRPDLVPYVPADRLRLSGRDPEEIDRMLEAAYAPWIAKNGVRILAHSPPPWTARRWLGVIPGSELLGEHVLVMSGRECLFDPARCLPARADEPALEGYGVDEIEYGLTIE
jgi:hypothetical protein